MKKVSLFLLAFALTLSLCACGAPQNDTAASDPGDTETQTVPQHHDDDHNEHADHTVVIEPPAAPEDDTAGQSDSAPEETPNEAPSGANETAQQPEEAPVKIDAPPVQSQPVETQKPASKPEPEPEPTPAPAPAPEPQPEPAPAPEPEPEPAPQPAADPKATAQGLVGHQVSELYAAIGHPISSDYAPSCLDLEGEDGELVYDGFVVYTLKTASGETIDSVA